MRPLLMKFGRPYWRLVTIVVVLIAVQALANLYLPNLNADILNNGVVKGDNNYILRTGALMLGITFALGVASIVGVYFGAKTAMSIGRDLRSAVFRKVMDFSQRETNVFGTPTLITRNTNDVQQIQMVIVLALNMMIMAPIMSIGGLFMALQEDVPLTGTLVVIIPLVIGVITAVALVAIPLSRTMQKRTDRINQVMREKLAGVRVIRAFVRTEREEERFDQANTELTNTSLRMANLFSIMIPFLFGVMNISTVAIVWFGGLRIDSGQMQIGNLSAFLQYVMLILFSIMMAALMFIMVPRAAAASERIKEVLDLDGSICNPAEPAAIPSPRGEVAFENVEFRYPGAEDPVLSGITFTARPGETTAIIGGTGSGKTTLINLIPRFYDVTGGRVSIDGVDVRDIGLEELWKLIGIVPQKAFLFSGTVASNMRYGDVDATDEEIWRALDIAQAKGFVLEKDGQLDGEIDQGGTNVSGGQRQRLAIARAIAKRPKVYIFDDSFSALDFKTDQLLRAALREETADSTVIIVAQRVGTIMHADQIVVLDQGSVVGIGTHKELMETCPTYPEIVYSQLTREEVA